MQYAYGTAEWDQAYEETLRERLETETRPFIYMSPEWVHDWENAIQGDAVYREAARNWEGSVVLHILANSSYGIDFDLYIFMDLWHGDAHYVKLVPEKTGEAGDFVITGSMDQWIKVGRKELDVVKGMMQGKLKLKGDLPTIVRAIKAAIRLVELSTEVGGRFPDELSPGEVEEIRGWASDLAFRFLVEGAAVGA